MRVANILDRVAGLGSDKWRVHVRARKLIAQGEPVVLLTIGEPDVPTPPPLVDAACQAMGSDLRLDTESVRAFLGRFVTLP